MNVMSLDVSSRLTFYQEKCVPWQFISRVIERFYRIGHGITKFNYVKPMKSSYLKLISFQNLRVFPRVFSFPSSRKVQRSSRSCFTSFCKPKLSLHPQTFEKTTNYR